MPLSNWTVMPAREPVSRASCFSFTTFVFIQNQIKSKIPPAPFEKGGENKIKVKVTGYRLTGRYDTLGVMDDKVLFLSGSSVIFQF